MENINNTVFYRYYFENKMPFEVSVESTNRYGDAIYFLDNPYYYKDKFKDNSRLITIKPKLKNPLILRTHKNQVPSIEYTKLMMTLIAHKEIKNRKQLIEKLIKDGYDSLVVYEPRGIYLVLFYNDPELYDIVSDVKLSEEAQKLAVGGEISPLPFVSASATASIKDVLTLNKYKDLSETEASIIYGKWKNDVNASHWFDTDKGKFHSAYVDKLVDKNYIEMDYESTSYISDYKLTEKGKEFIESVSNRHQTRIGVKKGTDLFPESSNIKEILEVQEKQKKQWSKIGDKFSNENYSDLYGDDVMNLIRKK